MAKRNMHNYKNEIWTTVEEHLYWKTGANVFIFDKVRMALLSDFSPTAGHPVFAIRGHIQTQTQSEIRGVREQ